MHKVTLNYKRPLQFAEAFFMDFIVKTGWFCYNEEKVYGPDGSVR